MTKILRNLKKTSGISIVFFFLLTSYTNCSPNQFGDPVGATDLASGQGTLPEGEEDENPPPTTNNPPVQVPPAPIQVDLGKVAFQNVTTAVIDYSPVVDYAFDADFMHGNDDGCFDLFIGTHNGGASTSNMFLQNTLNGKCTGTFTYYPADVGNYSQPSGVRRITSSYTFGDLNGDGQWDFYGWDVDGGASGMFLNNSAKGAVNPIYRDKVVGCWGARNRCVPADINGDGNMDLVGMEDSDKTETIPSPIEKYREIRDVVTGAVLYPSVSMTAGEGYGGHYLIFDTDGDSWPDIVDVWGRGYWKNSKGVLAWKKDVLPAGNFNYGGGQTALFDYDADGDQDIIHFSHAYGTSGVSSPRLFRNEGNGVFAEKTIESGITGLVSTSYWTTYANSIIGDMNNDGYPDIIFSGENYSNTVSIIWNNGNGTFSVDRSTKFGTADGGKPRTAIADYDNDGRLDILKTQGASSATINSVGLFRNQSNTGNHWMRVRVHGKGKNTDGVHTRLVWKVAGTNKVITSYDVYNTPWFNQLQPHAGLGKNTLVDLEVQFPHDGPAYKYTNLAVDQEVIINYQGQITQGYQPGNGW